MNEYVSNRAVEPPAEPRLSSFAGVGEAVSESASTQQLDDFEPTFKQSALELSPGVSNYSALVLISLAIAATLVTGYLTEYFSTDMLWVAAGCLIYPHLMQGLYVRLRRRLKSNQAGFIFVSLHGLVMGGFLMLIGLTPIISLLFVIMCLYGFMVASGLSAFLLGGLCMSLGMLLGALGFGLHYAEPPPWPITLICPLFVGVYIIFTAYVSHKQALRLHNAREHIRQQQVQSKELSYKLGKYLAPQIWRAVFSGTNTVKLETRRKKLVAFFSDIKGFTGLSEMLEPEELTEMLNRYLTDMSRIAMEHGGTIDKFMGDGIMVFFGDPESQGTKKDTQACVAMALSMRKHMKVLKQQWRSRGIRNPLEIRMGINVGYCTVGNFGTESRMDYTVIGKEVNLASRLETIAKAGEILVSHEVFSLIKDSIMCRDKGSIQVKGFSQPVPVYELVDYRKNLGARKSFVEHESDGFSMYLDTEKINAYNRDQVIDALEKAAETLKDKIIP